MDYMNRNIAFNLKKLRKAKHMSLDEMAEQTGVSKSMLANIERGEANPSIGCLGKIMSGMRVDLKDLLEPPRQDTYHILKEEMVPTKESKGQYCIYTYFPYESERKFEVYGMEISSAGVYYSGSHGENTIEYITVSSGTLTLKVRDRTYQINAGDAFRFDSDSDHWYMNEGTEVVRVIATFSFP